MNVAAMHRAVNQGVQKIASQQVDLLLPQEIDLELNKSQMKFIKTRYSQFGNKYMRGFEGSQKRIDDLRTLIKEASINTTYKGQISNKHYVDTAVLPADYMFLVNQRSLSVHNNCEPINFGTVETGQYWIEVPLTNENFLCDNSRQVSDWIATSIPGYAAKTCSSYTTAICDGVVSGTISGPRYLGYMQVHGLDENGNSQLVNTTAIGSGAALPPSTNSWTPATIVAAQNPSATEAYYSETQPNGDVPFNIYPGGTLCIIFPIGFVIPDLTAQFPPSGGTSQFRGGYYGGDCTNTGHFQNHDYEYSSLNIYNTDSGGYMTVSRDTVSSFDLNDLELGTESAGNRWAQHDDIYSMLSDPFNTTKHTSPLTTIRGNSIDIYTDNTFFVPKLKITYIERPTDINVTSGANCLLPDHTHEEIVTMAVASILEAFSDGRYQTIQNEVNTSE